MTANQTTFDDSKNVASTANTTGEQDTPSDLQYHCPHCDKHYTNEIFTRVHITRSDDAAHVNRDGFMPETKIRVTTPDGTHHDTLSKRPRDINAQSVTLNDFPNDLTDRHKLILLAATHNPNETEYTELKNRADELFEEHGHDPLSYATVRRVTRRFYRPDTGDRVTAPHNTTNTDTEQELTRSEQINKHGTLTDLTPTQQAIIIATVTHPDDSNVKTADRVNTSQSYPSQVTEKFNEITDRIRNQVNNGDDPATVIGSELTDEDITTLTAKQLLDDIALEPDNLRTPDTNDDVNTATDNTDRDEPSHHTPPVDRAVHEQNTVMRASPYNTPSTADTADDTADASVDTDSTSSSEKASDTRDTDTAEPANDRDADTYTMSDAMQDHEHNTDTHGDATSDRGTDGDSSNENMIPRSRIEELKKHVEFERRLAEHTRDGTPSPGAGTEGRVAFATVMETELNAILNEQPHANTE